MVLAQLQSGILRTELIHHLATEPVEDAGSIIRASFVPRYYLAITTVVQELLSLGRSRLPAMRIRSDLRFPRTMGQ